MDYEAYIGKKGYSILKSKLTIDEQKMIRDELNVKPYVPGSPINVTESYPVYLESPKKLYLPRFYGIQLFSHVYCPRHHHQVYLYSYKMYYDLSFHYLYI